MATQTFTIHTENSEQTNALKAFVKALKMKFEISKTETDVTEEHKKLVRDRIKNSKSEELLDWDKVKNNFNGI